mmetsp:Transcript_1135/g.1333  ORF Transcript_1135/g.1333 Transcript_1135/m.1333 type:complete len:420 (-) Transcript_1135:4051-5310(-)
MRCFLCKERLKQLELAHDDQTIATSFKTSHIRASVFHVDDMFIAADPESILGVVYKDQTVDGFDVTYGPLFSVSTIEECRFRCQWSTKCEFFVFSESEGTCALKMDAPYSTRSASRGSIIGTKYSRITCGSRVHTYMQRDRLQFNQALVQIRKQFPVCSEVCRTYNEAFGATDPPQTLQMLTKTRVPGPVDLSNLPLNARIRAMLTVPHSIWFGSDTTWDGYSITFYLHDPARNRLEYRYAPLVRWRWRESGHQPPFAPQQMNYQTAVLLSPNKPPECPFYLVPGDRRVTDCSGSRRFFDSWRRPEVEDISLRERLGFCLSARVGPMSIVHVYEVPVGEFVNAIFSMQVDNLGQCIGPDFPQLLHSNVHEDPSIVEALAVKGDRCQVCCVHSPFLSLLSPPRTQVLLSFLPVVAPESTV